MACPYFCPNETLAWSRWQGNFRPPLGEPYAGECHARPAEPYQPDDKTLLEACNLGYAAAECERFPAGEGPDALRFAVTADEGPEIRIRYVFEKAHLPFRHGLLTYDLERQTWAGLEPGTLLHRQAEAYLNSYLRWKESRLDSQVPGRKKAAKAKA